MGLAAPSNSLSHRLLQLPQTILTVVRNGFEVHSRGSTLIGPTWWICGSNSKPISVSQSGRTCSRVRSDSDPQKTHCRATVLFHPVDAGRRARLVQSMSVAEETGQLFLETISMTTSPGPRSPAAGGRTQRASMSALRTISASAWPLVTTKKAARVAEDPRTGHRGHGGRRRTAHGSDPGRRGPGWLQLRAGARILVLSWC
jgi:hypothetical protein